jgi:hypothetical protein
MHMHMCMHLCVTVHARALAEAHGMRAVTRPDEIDEIRRAVGRGGLGGLGGLGEVGEAGEAGGGEGGEATEAEAAAAVSLVRVQMAEVGMEMEAGIEAEAEAEAEAEMEMDVDADADERGAHRRARLRRASGLAALPRAVGPGWLCANPLGGHLSETEAKLELDGQRVHRCLLRV